MLISKYEWLLKNDKKHDSVNTEKIVFNRILAKSLTSLSNLRHNLFNGSLSGFVWIFVATLHKVFEIRHGNIKLLLKTWECCLSLCRLYSGFLESKKYAPDVPSFQYKVIPFSFHLVPQIASLGMKDTAIIYQQWQNIALLQLCCLSSSIAITSSFPSCSRFLLVFITWFLSFWTFFTFSTYNL